MGGRRDLGPSGNSVSIDAENTFSEDIFIDKDRDGNLSVEGTWDGAVTLQYRKVNSSTWYDRDTTLENGLWYFQGAGKYWRAGIKTGDYTSGTAEVNISG